LEKLSGDLIKGSLEFKVYELLATGKDNKRFVVTLFDTTILQLERHKDKKVHVKRIHLIRRSLRSCMLHPAAVSLFWYWS
jgi:hypothetical protein